MRRPFRFHQTGAVRFNQPLTLKPVLSRDQAGGRIHYEHLPIEFRD
jgi:hypothetical protein